MKRQEERPWAAYPPLRPFQPRPPPARAQPRKCREQEHRVGPDVGHIPQVVPGEVALRIAARGECGGIEIPKRGVLLMVIEPLVINLGRDDDEHPEDQRQQQALVAFEEKPPGGVTFHGEPDGGAGDEEEQGHSPLVHEPHDVVEPRVGLDVLDVPIPGAEQHARVEEHEQGEGNHPQPIQVVAPIHVRAPICRLNNTVLRRLASIMSPTAVPGEPKAAPAARTARRRD